MDNRSRWPSGRNGLGSHPSARTEPVLAMPSEPSPVHTQSLPAPVWRLILGSALCVGLASVVTSSLGQTNDDDALQPQNLHNLTSLPGFLHLALWILASALLVIAVVCIAVRYRLATNLYKASSDTKWTTEAPADAGERVEATEIIGACEVLEEAGQQVDAGKPAAKTVPSPQVRLFTPASGEAWGEPMLKAFLSTCMKVNCLGRLWRESAARQVQASNSPDPREAELIRRLMQRWQEFHVDPETGVYLEHSSGMSRSRICILGVTRDKHTISGAAINAGFVIETIGRYLKGMDLVYLRGPGEYHAPTKGDLTLMTPGEKESMMRITEIPDPWQSMIA
ncbi:MAG: hypothetical protein ACREIC_07645 [Limisphaerales bacterium]